VSLRLYCVSKKKNLDMSLVQNYETEGVDIYLASCCSILLTL
jgi:hypothetical protein